uniref:Thioredoxin domain-containing protein n=1 Tax=Anas platyrhynchos platyrhynchos TaxID=8840 RepID=A0A493STG4_ANAPP
MKRLSFSCLLKMLKCQSILFQTTITNQNQWDEMLLTKGVVVIDVYQAWCGPCKAVVNLFRKLKNEFSEDDVLHFAVAEANSIETLQPYRNRCEPVFLFFSLLQNGKIIEMVRGANAPLISKKITELVQEEREIVAGQKERPEVYSQKIYLNIEEYFYYTSMVSLNFSFVILIPFKFLVLYIESSLEKSSILNCSFSTAPSCTWNMSLPYDPKHKLFTQNVDSRDGQVLPHTLRHALSAGVIYLLQPLFGYLSIKVEKC